MDLWTACSATNSFSWHHWISVAARIGIGRRQARNVDLTRVPAGNPANMLHTCRELMEPVGIIPRKGFWLVQGGFRCILELDADLAVHGAPRGG